jgi:dUTP pyrophosphatase
MNIKFLNEYAKVPTRGSSYAAGYDLYAAIGEPVTVFPGTTVPVTTGLAMEIPEDFFGAIFARSGLATKRGLRPANCVGVVDADYRGEVIVAIHNDSNEAQQINPGERIAQMVFLPYRGMGNFEVVDELSETVRGVGGFGSTGR